MKTRNLNKKVVLLAVMAILIAGIAAYGQYVENSEDNRSGGRGRGADFRNMSDEQRQEMMEQFRAKMYERIRTQLGFSEEEWQVVLPLYEKVMKLQREQSMGHRMGGPMMGAGRPPMGGGSMMGAGGPPRGNDNQENSNRNRRRGPGGDRDQRDQSEVGKARKALQTVLGNDASTEEQVKTALDSYRKAKTKAAQELAAARKSLKELLTPRQEAQFVVMGVLE